MADIYHQQDGFNMISQFIWWLANIFCKDQIEDTFEQGYEKGYWFAHEDTYLTAFQDGLNSALKSGNETTVPSQEWESLKEIERRIKSEGIEPLPTIICKS